MPHSTHVVAAAEEQHRDDGEQHASFELVQHVLRFISRALKAAPTTDFSLAGRHLSARYSAIGPSTATGMNISSPRMTTTAHSVTPKVALSARSDPAVSGAAGFAARGRRPAPSAR